MPPTILPLLRVIRRGGALALLVASLLTAVAADAPQAADPRTYLADVTAQLAISWPSNRTVNLVCHGHSVPAGYFKTPVVDTFNAYPHLLHRELKARFPHAVLNVIVTGIGGENSERGARRFAQDVLTLRPDVVTIDYALNDRRIGLARAEAAWRSMIEAARAQQVKVILLTPTADVSVDWLDSQNPLAAHAEQIRRLAREYHVGLADSYAAFEQFAKTNGAVTNLMSQFNHPNRQGHDLVTAELARWFLATPRPHTNPNSATNPPPSLP